MSPKTPAILATLTALAAAPPAGLAQAGPSGHAGPPVEHGPDFDDVSSLLDFQRVDDPLTEKLGGAAWLDYDDDGDLDLFLANAPGGENGLFRNDGGSFTNVAVDAGVTGDALGYTGALAADVDNDGCTDLFLTGAGAFFGIINPHRLYLNDCDGTFSDVTAASGIDPGHNGLMGAFGDIDNDGFVDLFVTSPGNFFLGALTTQKLYHNNGDGTFSDISSSAGIDTAEGGCVVGFSDFDRDSNLDIIVGNCNTVDLSGPQPWPAPGPWELWINQGDLTFVDHADQAGLNVRPGFPTALAISDYDLDGDFDVFATGAGAADPYGAGGILSEQVLFQNDGWGNFVDVTYDAGLGGQGLAWGAAFSDFDADGDGDLVTVGTIALSFLQILGDIAGPGIVYDNDGSGQMTGVLDFGLEHQYPTGLAVADYDADGFTHIVITKTAFAYDDGPVFPAVAGDGEPVLLHNVGNGNQSVTLRLIGTDSNAMGIGAQVELITLSGTQVQQVSAGSSFASTDSPWLTFGAGGRHWGWAVVSWPSGLVEGFFVSTHWGMVDLEEGTGLQL